MRNRIFITVTLLLTSLVCFSQKQITWKDLSAVKFTEKYFVDYEDTFLYPEFLPSVKALEGKRVTIKGYYLNIAPENRIYVLSKSPMSSCFFCGAAGPETSIQLQFMIEPPYKTDDIVLVTGTLKLNSDDVDHLNYILMDCEISLVK